MGLALLVFEVPAPTGSPKKRKLRFIRHPESRLLGGPERAPAAHGAQAATRDGPARLSCVLRGSPACGPQASGCSLCSVPRFPAANPTSGFPDPTPLRRPPSGQGAGTHPTVSPGVNRCCRTMAEGQLRGKRQRARRGDSLLD